MTKYAAAAFLVLALPAQSALALSCTQVFTQTNLFYTLGKDLQMNILDLAEFNFTNPEHKSSASDWSRYAVARYRISPQIIRISIRDIYKLKLSYQRDYAYSLIEKYFELHPNVNESNIYFTLITDSANAVIAAKINSTYFDLNGNVIKLTYPR